MNYLFNLLQAIYIIEWFHAISVVEANKVLLLRRNVDDEMNVMICG